MVFLADPIFTRVITTMLQMFLWGVGIGGFLFLRFYDK
jgi:hypothetical protein